MLRSSKRQICGPTGELRLALLQESDHRRLEIRGVAGLALRDTLVAACSSSSIAKLSAFSVSGRLRVTVAIAAGLTASLM